MLLSSSCVISSVCRSGGVSSQASASEKKRSCESSLARYPSAFVFEMNSSQLTGFKLRQLGHAFICGAADPARNSETDRQHVPDTQE